MNFKQFLLISASLGIGIVGLGYLISPEFMYGLYNIEIASVNQFNMVRGAYGGLFLGFSILFFIGAINEKIEFPSIVSLFVFMCGFAIGRITGIVVEGMPGILIICLLLFELFYSICSAYYIFLKNETGT
ncbi:MAG: DUF4345 domain-containing protein [Thiotrichales bacterium]|nr:DUF4345 domain-containing protein [Thiotrichales bacterium]